MMRLGDRYVAFSPSSLQSMFAECVAVIKLCGNVAKLLVDSTAINLEGGPRGIISHRPSFLGSYEALCTERQPEVLFWRKKSVSAIS
jgi:hypothetical protein